MLRLDVLHCFCGLCERCVRAEDTDKFLFNRVLGAEPLDGLARKWFVLIEPLWRVEDFLEIREIFVVDLLN